LFFFLKQKQRLEDLIPEDYVDIHSHLLPGIDDGAKSVNDTLFLLNSMKKMGFEQFTATPHVITNIWDNTKSIIENSKESLLENFERRNLSVDLHAAAEYMMDESFVKLFKSEKLLTLKDNYVLVEMSYINAPIQLYDIIFELQVAGYVPVLAHPERYVFYHQNFSEYAKLKKAGCLFQLNLLSSVGYYGKRETETAQKLLDKGFIDFTGSDIHHEKHIRSFADRVLLKKTEPLMEALKNNVFFKR